MEEIELLVEERLASDSLLVDCVGDGAIRSFSSFAAFVCMCLMAEW
jgi:hypothetical protein